MKPIYITVPAILLLGWLSGAVAGSTETNAWYASLAKPVLLPPGISFGIVWSILYALMGVALARLIAAPRHPQKPRALAWFAVQLAMNLGWSSLFFRFHLVEMAFYLILAILAAALWTTWLFGRIDRPAARLMVPYLVWLSFAAGLAYRTWQLNPLG
jgi:tryptophan-rich sensory protein